MTGPTFPSNLLRWFRRSTDESLSSAGSILRVGTYEHWVRRIAVLGLIHVGLVAIRTLFRIPQAIGSPSEAMAIVAMLGLSLVASLGLVARARGNGFPRRKRWIRSEVWGTWSGVCLLTAIFSDPHAQRVRIILMLTILIPIGASILDRIGLPEPERSDSSKT